VEKHLNDNNYLLQEDEQYEKIEWKGLTSFSRPTGALLLVRFIVCIQIFSLSE